jgi:Predicted SAM-dependent methyltransferase
MNQHTPAASLHCAGLIGYCRAGFEKELAAELDDLAAEAGLIGFVRAEPDSGFVVYETFEPTPLGNFGEATDWRRATFARQLLPWFAASRTCPSAIAPRRSSTRSRPAASASRRDAGDPDTDEAKQRSGFCKRFTEPLATALEKAGCLRSSRAGLPVLHVLFTDATTAWLAAGQPGQCSTWRWASRACACPRTPPAAPPPSSPKPS